MSFSIGGLHKYELIKEIGSGTFGTLEYSFFNSITDIGRVWMAKDLESNEFIAIKRRPKWQNMMR